MSKQFFERKFDIVGIFLKISPKFMLHGKTDTKPQKHKKFMEQRF